VSTRILFADDSVTAQNMGKRILTEAGYEVVAVSNGAAAVKKIAEQKPDIIILDLYMPGYSGLEVCEKVRGSMATLKTPVLLTVGKMEPPPRPEDANRVRADGVIVKPFEASDLLAIVKKFEERLAAAPPPLARPAPAPVTSEEDFSIVNEPEVLQPRSSMPIQPMVDVPDHMAGNSAFSDLLGTDGDEPAPTPAAAAHETPAPSRPSVPEYELPVNWRAEDNAANTEIEVPATSPGMVPPQHDVQVFDAAPVQESAPPSQANDVAPPSASRPLQIPVYQESGEVAQPLDVARTSAPPIGEIEIPRDPYLDEGAAEATRRTIVTSREPGLISDLQPEPQQWPHPQARPAEIAPAESDFLIESPEVPVDVPVQESAETEAPATHHETAATDSDFEARVAAVLASYKHAETNAPAEEIHSADTTPARHVPEIPTYEPPAAEAAPAPSPEASHITAQRPSMKADPLELEPEPPAALEYHPPAGIAQHEPQPELAPAPNNLEPDYAVAHEPEPVATQEPPPVAVVQDTPVQIASSPIEESVAQATQELAAAAGAETESGRDNIAQAVHRVMERLKPELVNEILRELKPKD
jgi:CheY-like chemotaxis protein